MSVISSYFAALLLFLATFNGIAIATTNNPTQFTTTALETEPTRVYSTASSAYSTALKTESTPVYSTASPVYSTESETEPTPENIETTSETIATSSEVDICDDFDTSACELMYQSKPDLCEEPGVAETACRRFCGYCCEYENTYFESQNSYSFIY